MAHGTEQASRKRGRPRGADDAVGRERVIETATRLFLQHGYASTSLKMIAQELNISAPALYWYFPSKDEIYSVVIESAMRDFVSFVGDSLTAEDPETRLGQIVRAHVTWQLRRSDAARVFAVAMGVRALVHELPPDRVEEIVTLERGYLNDVRKVLQQGCDEGVFHVADTTTTAFAIMTMCEYVHTWYRPGGALSIEAVANRYEQLALSMVGATPATLRRA